MADKSTSSSTPLTWLIDPVQPTGDQAEERYRFTGSVRSWLLPSALGAALFLISFVALFVGESTRFFYAYLTGWSFLLSIALGALFFLLIHHVPKTHWSTVVRRIAEAVAFSFPMLAVLFIPILFGMNEIYSWSIPEKIDPASPEYDAIIDGKSPYLNEPFFYARMAFYLIVWTIMSHKLYARSLESDVNHKPDTNYNLRFTSAWGIPVFGITVYFASMDLLMTLEPHWYSTIFGVYFFAGAFLSAVCLITLLSAFLQRDGMLTSVITTEHYQDLGKWIFAMTAFWAYIGTSQYMLLWYANIPETTVWYRVRFEGGWEAHSIALVLFHFVLPFLILLPRASKRWLSLLCVMAGWMLVMHYFDLHWVTVPNAFTEGGFHWVDISLWLGLFGLFIGAIMFRLSRHPLVPQNDPYLERSLRFENF